MAGQLYRAGCVCGAVRLEVGGEPAVQAYCHCESCRTWLGAPVHASMRWPTPDVKVENGADNLAVYRYESELKDHTAARFGGPTRCAARLERLLDGWPRTEGFSSGQAGQFLNVLAHECGKDGGASTDVGSGSSLRPSVFTTTPYWQKGRRRPVPRRTNHPARYGTPDHPSRAVH